MRTQIRIVAGRLRGRKVSCVVDANLRPTPQMVREALFSILGDAVPDRPFFDVFAGTGVVGLEALSRGASSTTFIERDFRLAGAIEQHAKAFGIADQVTIIRGDVYRWIDRWLAPKQPVNVFLSPPFADLDRRPEELLGVIARLQQELHPGSVLILQSERHALTDDLARDPAWDPRRYGRNELWFWVKPEPAPAEGS